MMRTRSTLDWHFIRCQFIWSTVKRMAG